MKQRILYFVLPIVLGLLLVIIQTSMAGDHAVWQSGMVTRTPVMVKSHYEIEVDGVRYSFLPDIRITYRYLRNKGAYNERNCTVHSIIRGQNLMMKIRGKNVLQIILY